MILCSSRLTNDVIRNEADMFEKFSRRVEPKEANNLTQPLIHVSLQQTTEVSLLLFDTPTHTLQFILYFHSCLQTKPYMMYVIKVFSVLYCTYYLYPQQMVVNHFSLNLVHVEIENDPNHEVVQLTST